MNESSIILFNKKIGLRTVFFREENGVLGYSCGYTIYLNKFYMNDLNYINRHEVLHFYENSNLFKRVKKFILNVLTRYKLNRLRELYFNNYKNLCSYFNVLDVIDNEIVIDIVAGNIRSELNFLDVYNEIVSKEKAQFVDGKRYLNLLVPLKIKQNFKELSDWEKIFVTNYYETSENELPIDRVRKYDDIRKTIKLELEQLYTIAGHELNFTISPYSKDIIREYEIELKSLSGREKEYAYFCKHKSNILSKKAKKYTQILHAEYKNIVEIIRNCDYEDAFKYLMLNETLSKVYRQKSESGDIKFLVDKRNSEESIKSHMLLNEKVLFVIYKNVNVYNNFSTLYFYALRMFYDSIKNSGEVVLTGLNTFNMGKWIKFAGKNCQPLSYLRNAEKLSAMVVDTPWCTKEQAASHLADGDFYLFVDNDNNPHVGIKLIGDRIDEVRGIKNGNAQEIEEEYRDVVIEFLTKNSDVKFGKEWLDKEIWNKRLYSYIEKIENGSFDSIDIKELIYDLTEVVDYKAHYAQCGNRKELLSKIKNIDFLKKVIAKKYGCRSKMVFIGDVDCKKDFRGEVFPYSIVLGNVENRGDSHLKCDFRNLRIVFGNFDVANANVSNLNNLELIGGSANFSSTSIDKMDSLRLIGEIADFYDSRIGSMKSLMKIGGSANFIFSRIGDLSKLETIGEDAYFDHAIIGDLSSFKRIEGSVNVSNATLNKLSNVVCLGRVVGVMSENDAKVFQKNIMSR